MKSFRTAWICWILGAVLFPIGGRIAMVPDAAPITVLLFSGRPGMLAWIIWAAAFALMTYAVAKLENIPKRLAITAQIVGGLIMVLTPVMPSNDPLAYFLYGEMSIHGENPWSPVHIEPSRDPVAAAGTAVWHNPPVPCVYGPVFVAAESLLVRIISAQHVLSLIVAQRVLSLLAAIVVTWSLRTRSAAGWALHPLVLFEAAVGAHNDILMIFILALAARMRFSSVPLFAAALSGALIASAGMVKIIALGAAAFRPRTIIWTVLAVGGIAAATHGTIGIGQLKQHQSLYPVNSPTLLVATAVEYISHNTKIAVRAAKLFVNMSAAVLLLRIAYLFYLRRQIRRNAAAFATLTFIGTISIIYPWYFTWLVFAAAFAHRNVRIAAGIIASLSFILDYRGFVSWSPVVGITGTIVLWAAVALITIQSAKYESMTRSSAPLTP